MMISEITPGEHGLTVRWSGGQDATFEWFWLRDHGEDEGSLDPGTLQRRVDTFAIPQGISAQDCQIAGNGASLQITWPDKAAPSAYSAAYLARMAGFAPSEAALTPGHQPRLWSAQNMLDLPKPVPFGDFMETDASRRAALERVHLNGFAIVDGVPTDKESSRQLLERVGYIRTTIFGGLWPLSSQVTAHEDTAYTTDYLEPHTDGTYCHDAPGLQSFVCMEFDGTGGESVLVDGFALAEDMRLSEPAHFKTLTEVDVPGRYIEPGVHLRAERPPFRLGSDGAMAQISVNNYDRAPFILPPDQMRAFYAAYTALHARIIDQDNWLKIPLRPGMAMIFDNWRCLHGRMGYTGKRFFYGCYHNHEDLESALRTTRTD